MIHTKLFYHHIVVMHFSCVESGLFTSGLCLISSVSLSCHVDLPLYTNNIKQKVKCCNTSRLQWLEFLFSVLKIKCYNLQRLWCFNLALALSKHWWAACKPQRNTELYASCCVPSCCMSFEVLQPTRLHEEWAKTNWGCQMAYYCYVCASTIKCNQSLKQQQSCG